MRSKVAIVSSAIMGKISSILGYFFGLLMLVVLVVPDKDVNFEPGEIIFLLVILLICGYGVFNGIRIKQRIFRFKKYTAMVSMQNTTSIDALAAGTGKTAEFVKKDLEVMIRKRFFVNAVIDHAANELVIKGIPSIAAGVNPNQVKAVTCKNCAASNRVIIGQTAECPYCGSFLD
jgi:hypothetical protein